jgi:hypothetical protein
LPPSQEPLIAPRDGKEFATFILKHKAVLDTVGPYREFILAGAERVNEFETGGVRV